MMFKYLAPVKEEAVISNNSKKADNTDKRPEVTVKREESMASSSEEANLFADKLQDAVIWTKIMSKTQALK